MLQGFPARNPFYLSIRHGQAGIPPHLLLDLIHAADHAKFKATAGGCIIFFPAGKYILGGECERGMTAFHPLEAEKVTHFPLGGKRYFCPGLLKS